MVLMLLSAHSFPVLKTISVFCPKPFYFPLFKGKFASISIFFHYVDFVTVLFSFKKINEKLQRNRMALDSPTIHFEFILLIS